MTQQINLLRRQSKGTRAGWGWVGGIAVAVLFIWSYLHQSTSEAAALRAQVAQGEASAKVARDKLMAAQKLREGEEGAAVALATELADLRPKVERARQLITALDSGALGSAQGYSRHLGVLATTVQEGVWITQVGLSKNGSEMSLSGKALRGDAVMQYARRLNVSFKPLGVHFDAVNLTPELVPAPGSGAAANSSPANSPVSFKLS